MKEPRRIFVMGMPRTGTTIIAEVLMQNSNVIYLHEDPQNYPTSKFVDEKLNAGNYVIQKFPQRCLDLPRMLKRFPNAKFILMERDLEAVVKGYSAYPDPKALFVVQRRRLRRLKKIYNPVTIWLLYIAQISQYAKHPNCVHIQLKDFVLNWGVVLSQLERFLGLKLQPVVWNFAEKYITNEPVKDYPKGYYAWSFQKKKVTN